MAANVISEPQAKPYRREARRISRLKSRLIYQESEGKNDENCQERIAQHYSLE